MPAWPTRTPRWQTSRNAVLRTTVRSKSCRNSSTRGALAILALVLAGCATQPRETTVLRGETMGSAWSVTIAGSLPRPAAALEAGAQQRFEAVNQALSTWRADSALSRFNDDASGE